jgi:hypothetical protein
MKEFSQSTGPFKKWKNSEAIRARFLSDASEIIKGRVKGWLFYSVHHTLFDRIDSRYTLRGLFKSPYALAGRACVSVVNEWAQKEELDGGKAVDCIFEDGGPDKGGLLSALNIAPRFPDPLFRPSRDIVDRKTGLIRPAVVQLQAADFLAYEVSKFRREIAGKTGRAARKSLYSIIGEPNILMAICEESNIPRLCRIDELPKRE